MNETRTSIIRSWTVNHSRKNRSHVLHRIDHSVHSTQTEDHTYECTTQRWELWRGIFRTVRRYWSLSKALTWQRCDGFTQDSSTRAQQYTARLNVNHDSCMSKCMIESVSRYWASDICVSIDCCKERATGNFRNEFCKSRSWMILFEYLIDQPEWRNTIVPSKWV